MDIPSPDSIWLWDSTWPLQLHGEMFPIGRRSSVIWPNGSSFYI